MTRWLLVLGMVGGCAMPIKGVIAHTHIPGCIESNIALGCKPLYQPAEGTGQFTVYMACPDTVRFRKQGCYQR